MLAVTACQCELRAQQREADTARELAQFNATLRALRAQRLTTTESDFRAMLAEPESAPLPSMSAVATAFPADTPTHAQLTAAAEQLRAHRQLLRVRGHIALPHTLLPGRT